MGGVCTYYCPNLTTRKKMPDADTSDTLGHQVKPTVDETSDTQELDETNISRTHAQNVYANVSLDANCISMMIEQPGSELRVHDNLNLLELTAEEDDTKATAGIKLEPTESRRLAHRLMSMGTSDLLEQLDIDRHLGCSRIDISDRTTCYSYDDERDGIEVSADESQITLSPGDAKQLRDDLTHALEALREEQARRYDDLD